MAQNCYGVTHLWLSTGNKWRKNEAAISLADKLALKGHQVSEPSEFTKLITLDPPSVNPVCPSYMKELMWEFTLENQEGN